MEYKAVMENKRGVKYVLKEDVLKRSKLPKESLDKLETYNILVYVDDDGSTINIECFLLEDVIKEESLYKKNIIKQSSDNIMNALENDDICNEKNCPIFNICDMNSKDGGYNICNLLFEMVNEIEYR